jgi:DNA-binding NarL/FixJ family response regulator
MLPKGALTVQIKQDLKESKTRYQVIPPGYDPGPYKLSPREFEVRALLYKGVKNTEISKQLNIADKTIRLHKTNLFRKTGVKDITGLLSARIVELEAELRNK